jgi:hypothetical protein
MFVVFDLDGTLADCSHRVSLIEGHKRNWTAFFAACGGDKPIDHVIKVLNRHVQARDRVEIWSARSDEVRAETEEWLMINGIDPRRLVHMRKAGDYTQDDVLKHSWLIECGDMRPDVIYDDRSRVVNMWRTEGVPCFQVAATPWDAPSEKIIPPHADGHKLILMVGPSGAGKSHYCAANYPASWVISTDEIRKDLCGAATAQDRNDDVLRIASAQLSSGLSVVIDATHLRRKTRLEHAELALPTTEVEYVVVDRPMVEKERDGGWRNHVKFHTPQLKGGDPTWQDVFDAPKKIETLIEKHSQMFGSQIKDILRGDGNGAVVVRDLR